MLNLVLANKRIKGRLSKHRLICFLNYFVPSLQEYMVYRKHTYMRLDGSSKISERRDMVADFQSRWVKIWSTVCVCVCESVRMKPNTPFCQQPTVNLPFCILQQSVNSLILHVYVQICVRACVCVYFLASPHALVYISAQLRGAGVTLVLVVGERVCGLMKQLHSAALACMFHSACLSPLLKF